MNFEAFKCDIINNKWSVYGVEVYIDGRSIYRYGDIEEGRYPIYSATKSITAIAVGMAVDEGKLDVDRPIFAYLPIDVIAEMSEEQKAVYSKLSVKRLMCMSVVGYPFRPDGISWLRNALGIRVNPDEREFCYSNISAYLVGVAAACAVGEDLYEYLDRKLFKPIGIEKPSYMRCPDGYFYGASGMELSVRELSKIGLMLYHGGVYAGQRYLSERYVRDATAVQQMNREGGYGYFLWKYRDGFSINGKWGQKCYILPREKKVVTCLSHMEQGSQAVRESMERNLI